MNDICDTMFLYRGEHDACGNAAGVSHAVVGFLELNAGQLAEERPSWSTLVFVLRGRLRVSLSGCTDCEVGAGYFFLVPTGSVFCGEALEPVTLISYSFERYALCHGMSMSSLYKRLSSLSGEESSLFLLPVISLLREELEVTLHAMQARMPCLYYQVYKVDILFLMLRNLYDERQLARLFGPILSEDPDFKEKVLRSYSEVNRVKELCGLLHMSPTSFNRKFQSVFHMPAGEWLMLKKKESILRDIRLTRLSLVEIADKYNLTPNYLMAFCKERFHKTFSELRKSCAGENT